MTDYDHLRRLAALWANEDDPVPYYLMPKRASEPLVEALALLDTAEAERDSAVEAYHEALASDEYNRAQCDEARADVEQLLSDVTYWKGAAGRSYAEVERLRATLRATRDQLDRFGYGDFRWGDTPRDPEVVAAVQAADAALGGTTS